MSSVVCPLRSRQASATVPEPRTHMILGKPSNSQTKQQLSHKNKKETFGKEREGENGREKESREGYNN